MVLVVKSRGVFAIGVGDLIEPDPTLPSRERQAQQKLLSWEALQHRFAKWKSDCLQSKHTIIQQSQVLLQKGLWSDKRERAHVHMPSLTVLGNRDAAAGILQCLAGSGALRGCLMAVCEVQRDSWLHGPISSCAELLGPCPKWYGRRGMLYTNDVSRHGHPWVHTPAKAPRPMWRSRTLSRDPTFFPADLPKLLQREAVPWQEIDASFSLSF